MTPIECSTLARTFDLVRFFARSISSTTPRWRYRRFTKSCARGACSRITARWPRYAWSPHTRVSLPCNRLGSTVLSATLAGVAWTAWISLLRLSTPEMPLHPEIPLVSFLGLMHLGIARLVGILGRGRRVDDRGVDDRAGGHLQSLCHQMPLHFIKQ